MAKRLGFGTAGLRGPMKNGPLGINYETVARAAWAIGKYVQKHAKKEHPFVVVAYDARRNSKEFAQEVCRVLSSLQVAAHIFKEPVPTPLCSFAVTFLGAYAGIMITASHNPANDNGLKVYWRNGAQVTAPHDAAIEALIDQAPASRDLQKHDKALVFEIGASVIQAYFAAIERDVLKKPIKRNDEFRIVYTPLHGVGDAYAPKALMSAGFKNIKVVEQQKEPDGDFPTVKFPNPEEKGALDLAVALAKKNNASVILANDPDADRLAVMVLDREGKKWVALSGNEIGWLLADDLLRDQKENKLVATSVVSSRMLKAMAAVHGCTYVEALTGFPNIANAVLKAEKRKRKQFLFGYEEALGYWIGSFVHDKDGISAAARMAQLLSELQQDGQTVWDELDRISLNYGLYVGAQWSIRLKRSRIDAMMKSWRQKRAVRKVDYLNKRGALKTNLLELNLMGVRVLVRPSGTEPKIKFYLEAKAKAKDLRELETKRNELQAKLQAVKNKIALTK